MSFTPHNYRTGELIEAAPFNELEAQVALNEQNIETKLDADNPTATGDLTVAGAGSFGDEIVIGNNESVSMKISNQAILDETGQTIITKLLAIKTAIENGIYGKDGYSPMITITDITGGHRITIIDKLHPSGQSVDVIDGEDAFVPAVTITSITGGHTVKITDKNHPSGQTFNVMDGSDGDDGVSPQVTITAITGGHQVKITDAEHAIGQTFDVMDGEDGEAPIDDTTPAANKVYSSQKVNSEVTSLNQAIYDLELSTILIDSQGKFYIKEDE